MIDSVLVLKDKAFVVEQLARKGYDTTKIEVLAVALTKKKEMQGQLDELRRERNTIQKDNSIPAEYKKELRNRISDLEKEFGGVDKIPESLKGLEIKDYTDIMKQYFAKATEGISKDDEMYGLLPVNAELYGILQLYNAKFMGYDTDTEWLKACCYKVVVKGNN